MAHPSIRLMTKNQLPPVKQVGAYFAFAAFTNASLLEILLSAVFSLKFVSVLNLSGSGCCCKHTYHR